MVFVGVDLAWGPRATTGLCALEDGLVVDSAQRRDLGEVAGWIASRASGPCVVAIDAPIIVPNASGRRPCEGAITRCFGGHGAGAHPSNTSLRAFREGVRARLLADALGLDVDPGWPPGTPVRRAIEVYPHPALVALFGLERTPPYKAKRGRSLESRRRALLEVLDHLVSLRSLDPPADVTACPRWARLHAVVSTTRVAAEMSRAEDEIDAYLCAYIGLYYWTHGSARCRVVGDVATGYIVTPTSEAQAACLDELASRAPLRARPEVASPRRGA